MCCIAKVVTQLTLPVQQRDDASFANFYPGKNQNLLTFLQSFSTDLNNSYAYIWGHAGVGATHLLQASCQQVYERGMAAAYIPFNQVELLTPRVLENLESFPLICLDDVQLIAGKRAWEEALFHLYNGVQEVNGHLLIAAKAPPANLSLFLPDLTSRLASNLIFQIQPLDDAEKLAALKIRAKLRGLELSDEVGQFLLHRVPRDLPALFALLEKLDQMSLAKQRRLTIPFAKTVLLKHEISPLI